MAIQGQKPEEIVSVYDPILGAYHEVTIEDLRKQLASFGLSEEEIEAKIQKLTKKE